MLLTLYSSEAAPVKVTNRLRVAKNKDVSIRSDILGSLYLACAGAKDEMPSGAWVFFGVRSLNSLRG